MTPPIPETDSSIDPLDAKLVELDHHTPICVPCRRNYRCQLNGILVRLGPRAIIDADLYECPACGHQIVRGFARQAVEPHGPYKEIFAAQDTRMGAATITDHTGRPIDVVDALTEAGQARRALGERVKP
jgi:hypothetical protein